MKSKFKKTLLAVFTIIASASCSGGKKYNVTWNNWDGTLLAITEVAQGKLPAYTGKTPTKAADSQFDYVFDGWNPALKIVESNQFYVAQFSSVSLIESQTNKIIDFLKKDGFKDGNQYIVHTDGSKIFKEVQGMTGYTRFAYNTTTKSFALSRITLGVDDDLSVYTGGGALFDWGRFKQGTFNGTQTSTFSSGNEYNTTVTFTEIDFSTNINLMTWKNANYKSDIPLKPLVNQTLDFIFSNFKTGCGHVQTLLRNKISQPTLVLY